MTNTNSPVTTAKQESTVQQTFILSGEIRINFETHGHGSRTLLLLHGFGASLESWRDIQPHLETRFRVYLLDLKGHGLSSKPRDNKYSLQDQADIVTAFIREQRLKNVTLVGHSYGGGVAALTYLSLVESQETTAISSLILIDTASYGQRLPFFVESLRIPLLNDIILQVIPAATRASFTLRKLFFDPGLVTKERVERYARFFDAPGAHYAFKKCAAQILPPDADSFIPRLTKTAVPVQIVWGANDRAIPLSLGKRLQHDITRSRLDILPRCGHIPPEEKPVETSRLMTEFIDRC